MTTTDTRTPADPQPEGPICRQAATVGYCFHDSCGTVEPVTAGPLCEGRTLDYPCDHGSCAEAYRTQPAFVDCPKHGQVTITDSGSYTGFAGGTCYWAELSCGCHDVDESDDVRAAR